MIDKPITAMAGALPSLAMAGPVLAGVDRIDGQYYGHMWDGGWGIMGAGSMVLFWILIIALIVVAVRWLSAQNDGTGGGNAAETALRTLEERLAKGDIDVAEFQERKKALTG